MTLSAVALCNLAMDEIPAKQIVSLNDNTVSAEVCLRQFPQAMGEVMEAGKWDFGIRRVALTQVQNDRSAKWGYAYAVPNDVALPLSIQPPNTSGLTLVEGRSLPFDFEGSVLWSNMEGAVLEYITRSPEYAGMSATFERAVALTLASRVVVKITGDAGKKRELLQEAEVFRSRALANSLNRNGTLNTYGDNFVPSALAGYDFGLSDGGGGDPPVVSDQPVLAPSEPEAFDFAAYYNSLPEE